MMRPPITESFVKLGAPGGDQWANLESRDVALRRPVVDAAFVYFQIRGDGGRADQEIIAKFIECRHLQYRGVTESGRRRPDGGISKKTSRSIRPLLGASAPMLPAAQEAAFRS